MPVELLKEIPLWLMEAAAGAGVGEAARYSYYVIRERISTSEAFGLRGASEAELILIRNKIAEYAPPTVMAERPLNEMQELWCANPEIYSILESLPVDSIRLPEIVGFCVLYPLKKHSFDKFERCEMSGSDIGPQDVFLRKGVSPAGYYIGFVWGASRTAQGYLCMALRKQINDACKPGSKIFTRPITKRAVRFVNSNDFINLEKPDDKVGAYELCAATLPIAPTNKRMRNFV